MPVVDHLLDHGEHIGGLRLVAGLIAHETDTLGMFEPGPQRERSAHAQAHHDDLVDAIGESPVRGLDLAGPVGPSRSLTMSSTVVPWPGSRGIST